MTTLAVIPARGGSKGIPNKNIRLLLGKPLIAWTVEAALSAQQVDRVVVSTDSSEIATVARRFGAETVERPSGISGDSASSESALLHTLEELERAEGYHPDLLVFLQCTSPLTSSDDIDGVVEALTTSGADTALAVIPFHYFLWRPDGQDDAHGVNHHKSVRLLRQQRESEFLETGAVYVMKTAGFKEHKHRFFGKTALHVMPAERRWEIDDPVDLQVAEVLMQRQHQQQATDRLPCPVQLIVFDFDGVLTDNRVLVAEDGTESVLCDRGDGMAISWLRDSGIPALILSKERNGVVAARGRKVKLPVVQGIDNKPEFLRDYCAERSIDLGSVVYVGNDLNDLECMRMVGCPVAVADACEEVLKIAMIKLKRCGGRGAVREIIELILSQQKG